MRLIAPVAISLLVIPTALAKPPERPTIPEELKQACAQLKQGDACTTTMRGYTFAGTCEPLGNLGLVCRPRSRQAKAPPAQ